MRAISVAHAGLLALMTAGVGFCAAAAGDTVAVRIDTGELVGGPSQYNRQINRFLGVPYAAAPVGELRWRPPQPHRPWADPRPATAPGNPCWQPLVPETSIYSRGAISVSEDCLYLNVWTPGSSTAAPRSRPRPVMVWFHGGGNTTGHASSLIFDGTRLAEKGVIVVTANYRLGVFGFLAHADLSAESEHGSSGNYALLDQLAVLGWVHRNIAAFGGDPTRVVIFGQSAGALDVCLLMASPLAGGLMSGVLAHSLGCMQVTTPLADAEANGARLVAALGTVDLASLRHTPAETVAAAAASADVPISNPIVDGWVIPVAPRRMFAHGQHNRVPLIVGDMADEFRGLDAGDRELSRVEYEAAVRDRFPTIADALLELYAPVALRSPREALWKISTHATFTWQSRTWADLVARADGNAWVYHFTHPTAVFSLYIPERPEFPDPDGPRGLGAYHSGDLAYHFNNVGLVGLGWDDWDVRLADIITDYWVNFAASGDPNGEGLPAWPTYRASADRILEFGSHRIWPIDHPHRAAMALFDRAFPPPQ